jgi:hypothetical protein
MKNDGLADVEHRVCNGHIYVVVINHFEDEKEVWDTFLTEQEAIKEADKWNSGRIGLKIGEE